MAAVRNWNNIRYEEVDQRTIYVGNLPTCFVDENALWRLFQRRYGLVERVRIPLQPNRNQMVLRSRGFCYVTFKSLHSRNRAHLEGSVRVLFLTLQESRVLSFEDPICPAPRPLGLL